MLTFRAFGRKTPIVRKIWKILEHFQKNLTNSVWHFFRVWTKKRIYWKLWENFEIFWWQFNRKIEFLASFGKVVAKNRAFGNNTIFLQQSFRFRGGGTFPVFPPGGAYVLNWNCAFVTIRDLRHSNNCRCICALKGEHVKFPLREWGKLL